MPVLTVLLVRVTCSNKMTPDQAVKVLKTANGKAAGYVKVVKASKGRYGATHAATETGELACGIKPT